MRGFDCHREGYVFEKIFNFGTLSMGFSMLLFASLSLEFSQIIRFVVVFHF